VEKARHASGLWCVNNNSKPATQTQLISPKREYAICPVVSEEICRSHYKDNYYKNISNFSRKRSWKYFWRCWDASLSVDPQYCEHVATAFTQLPWDWTQLSGIDAGTVFDFD
jgi:hypothetical protein